MRILWRSGSVTIRRQWHDQERRRGRFLRGIPRVGNEFQPAKSCHLQLHSLIAVLSIGKSVDGRLL
jgi:hypothetical protein